MSASAASAGLVPSKTSLGAPSSEGCFFKSFATPDHHARIGRMRQALWGAATWFTNAMRGHRPLVAWMVTLTYAKADGWAPKHISEAIQRYRRWCAMRKLPCRYTWVAEIQDGKRRADKVGRGAVHYHLVAWLPEGVSMPFWDQPQTLSSRTRAVIWPHGQSERDKCRTGIGYLMKYASKGQNIEGFKFPPGLRVYGIGGLCEQGKDLRRWLALPEWAKRLHGVGELCRLGGRLVVRTTGQVLESPWRREVVQGGFYMRLLRPMEARWFSGPYSMIGARP